MTEQIKNVETRLKLTQAEFGFSALMNAIIIGPLDLKSIGPYYYVNAPTLTYHILANVPFKIARFFEDITT